MIRKRLTAGLMTVVMLLSLLPVTAIGAEAAESSEFDSILNMGQPSEFDPKGTENPYGYGVDQPFLMNEMSELGIYGINSNGNYNSFLWYDDWDGENDTIPNNFGKDAVNGSFSKYGYYQNMKKLAFVEMIAFDPTGSGRKDHIAYIGYQHEDDKMYVVVQDAADVSKKAEYALPGSASWLENDSGNPRNWRGGNYVAITAGDYDGDGKETLVAFDTADSEGDYGLYELRCDVSGSSISITQKSGGTALLHQRYVSDDLGMADEPHRGVKLSCDLVSGDFNGDGKDDLVAVSYLNGAKEGHWQHNCEYYQPMMGVSYGKAGADPVRDSGCQKLYLAVDEGTTNGVHKYQTMSAVGLDAGDIDGDGTDEIVVGGTKNTISSKTNSEDADDSFNLDAGTWNIAVLNARADGSFAQPGTDTSMTQFHSVPSTGWFSGGHGGEESRSPLSVDCVAFNGSVNAEYVLVGGKVLDFSTGSANEKYTISFLKDNDDYVQSNECDETFIPSVAVGNFDGNDYGYEQAFFVWVNKQSDEDDYYYRLGAIGGKGYDGQGGVSTGFYEKGSGFFMENQGGFGAEGNWRYYTNFALVAMDRDDDGVLARYKGKDYVYTDPQVSAVLQMAPYFDGLDLGSDSGETTYAFTQTYEYTQGTGNEVSYGFGVAGTGETSFVSVEYQAGSANTWSESFEETLTTSTNDAFATKAYDSVVLQRTPVFIYTYELYDKDHGGWCWDTLGPKEEGNGFAISVPKTPVYVQMTIGDYDKFVDEYNAMVDEKLQEYKDTTGEDYEPEHPLKLEKIAGQKAYLGQEGNPWAYADNLKQISSTSFELGYNGGETQSTRSDGSATTETIENSNGFSMEVSIMTGPNVFDQKAQIGGYASLEYMNTRSESRTTSSSIDTTGAVQNLDWQYLEETYGIPEAVTKSYSFRWALAKDKIDLGVGGSEVPVIAYNLSDIKAPAPAVGDLAAELQDEDSATLSWTMPDTDGRLKVTGYHLYQKNADGTYTKLTEQALDEDVTTYTVDGLKSNTTHTFVVTTTSENGESVWSNEASVTTPKARVPLTLTYNEEQASVKATHLGNVPIASGDKVQEDTIVYIDAAAQEGYTITGITLKQGDGEPETVTLSEEGTFNFVIREAAEITVTTAPVVESSAVSYVAESLGDDGVSVVGTISAVTEKGNSIPDSGGTVYGPVTFTAQPAEGYALKEWHVSKNGGKDVIAAVGNTWTFRPYEASHQISAVFVAVDDPDVSRTITVNAPASGGSIEITDASGSVLTPDENGQIQVVRGTEVTITAVPQNQYYVFQGWTGDLAEYKTEPTVTLRVPEDGLTIGADFRADLLYAVNFGAQNDVSGGGTVTASANGTAIDSGDLLVPETAVDFNAKADDGSRILKWAVTEGGITTFVTMDEKYGQTRVSEDSYTIASLKANTDVDAYFRTIETYDLNVAEAPGDPRGDVVVSRDGQTVSPGTDVLQIYDQVTITATPREGYELTGLTVNGESVASGSVITVTEDLKIVATFTPVRYDLSIDAGSGGSVDVQRSGQAVGAGSNVLTPGDVLTISATPESGYHLDSLTVNGAEFTSGETLTVDSDVSVQAAFARNSSPGGGGGIIIPPIDDAGSWDSVLDEIGAAEEGDKITIDISEDTEVPGEIFEAIADKDVEVTFELGDDLAWTVDGADIPDDTTFSDIDLGVTTGTDGIPVDVINTVTGEKGTVQVTLAHSGEFGFTMILTAPLGAENAGYWANLYHYDEDAEAMTFESAAQIAEDGTVQLPFSHASQFAIVIDDKSHASGEEWPFTDVDADDWFYDAVRYVYGEGLMTGTSASEFAPGLTTTRGMIVTILHRLEGEPVATGDAGFADVKADAYYAEAVNWAAEAGIVNGYSASAFGPTDPITREQMAAILMNYSEYKGMDTSARADLSSFSDAESVNTWAEEAVQWAVSEGLIKGVTADTIQPQGQATRAQVAAILQRYLEA